MAEGRQPGSTLLAEMQGEDRPSPERPIAFERDGEEVVVTSYGEFERRIEAAASWLEARGVGPGDVVAVWLPNWIEALVLGFAPADLEAQSLGVNTRYSVHELTAILTSGRPRGVVMPSRFLELDFGGRLREAWKAVAAGDPSAEAPWIATVRGAGDQRLDLGAGVFDLGDDGTPPPPRRPTSFAPKALSHAFTTSGSTGLPKLAAHDQAAVATHSRNVATAFEMDSSSVFLSVLPLSGVFGFNPAMGVLAACGAVLLEPRFDAKEVLSDMERFAVTHVVGGDDMLAQLMDAWEPGMRSSVRGGGIGDHNGRAAEFIAWAQSTWGATIGGVYGSSELFALTATWPADRGLEVRQRGGGVPVSPAIEVRIADPGSDAPVAVAVTGEIQVRGYNVLDAYLGRPGLLEQAFTDDGWFRSGDLGRLEPDGDGFVYVGRDSDALRLRGFLVEPKEIADFLADQPDVLAAQVVGAPGPRDSAVAVAFVRLAPTGSVSVDDLMNACRKELAPFKVPALIEPVESFPLVEGANGAKVKTAELRTRARALLAER